MIFRALARQRRLWPVFQCIDGGADDLLGVAEIECGMQLDLAKVHRLTPDRLRWR